MTPRSSKTSAAALTHLVPEEALPLALDALEIARQDVETLEDTVRRLEKEIADMRAVTADWDVDWDADYAAADDDGDYERYDP
jgi:hypothetical protein